MNRVRTHTSAAPLTVNENGGVSVVFTVCDHRSRMARWDAVVFVKPKHVASQVTGVAALPLLTNTNAPAVEWSGWGCVRVAAGYMLWHLPQTKHSCERVIRRRRRTRRV